MQKPELPAYLSSKKLNANMEWNEGLGDTSLDEIFNFTSQVQEGKKKKRSSILKQSKYANSEFVENEETVTDHRRKSQHMKRVSFAETFQVKELHTGNIYDIPGWNESNASKGSHSVEPETDGTEGNFTSRSIIPDSASILEPNPLKNKNDKESYAAPCKNNELEFILEPQYPPYSSIKNSSTEMLFENEIQAPYMAKKAVRDLLEDDHDMEMTMIHSRDNWSVASDSYGRNAFEEKNYTVETVISQSVRTWQASKGAAGEVSSFNYLFGDSPFKGGSQEYHDDKLSSGGLDDFYPKKFSHFSSITRTKKSSSPVSSGVQISKKNPQEHLNFLNKENIFQVSPKFQNLKFIDSPPSWMSGKQNVLKSCNRIDLEVQRPLDDCSPSQINVPKGIAIKKGAKDVSVQNRGKGLRLHSETVEDVCSKKVLAVQNVDCVTRTSESLPFQEKFSALNKTLHNVVPMDLTLLPEGFSEDSDVSCIQEQDRSVVNLNPCQNDVREEHKLSRRPANCNKVLENTINKTRLSTCDMEMTCLYDNPLENSSLCVYSPKNTDNAIMSNYVAPVWEQEESVDLKLYQSESKRLITGNAYSGDNIKVAGDFRERTHNKTRFSTCDMDMTCIVRSPMHEDSFSMSPPKDVEGNRKGTGEKLSAYVSTNKENIIPSRGRVSESTSFVTELPLKGSLPESDNTSSILETFHEVDGKAHSSASETELACNLKTRLQHDTSCSINRSAFQRVGSDSMSLTDSRTEKSSPWLSYGHKTLLQDGKYTQHFASQDMDLTCLKSNVQDGSVCATQADNDRVLREHPELPYFQLQEIPLVGSPNLENMNQSVGMGQRMFKLCTDNFSFSRASPKTSATRKRSLSLDRSKSNSSDLLSNALEDSSVKGKFAQAGFDSSLRVGTINVPRSVEVDEKDCIKSQKSSSAAETSLVRKQLQPRTPGVLYNIRRIRQSLRDGSNHSIIFPEFSQVMKKQKLNFKHPYSEIKITSPVCNPGKLFRSFDSCSRETNFNCQPPDSSVRLSIEPLPSASPKMLDSSPRKSLMCASVAFQESSNVPKANAAGEQPSGYEDSLQLLPDSVLESSFLDAASKNFTICLDKSDFVLKGSVSIAPPELCSLLTKGSVNASVKNDIEFVQVDSVSPLQDDLRLSSASNDKFEEMNTSATVENETELTRDVLSILPEINDSTQINTIEDSYADKEIALSVLSAQKQKYFLDKILENDILFQFPPLRSDSLGGTPSIHESSVLHETVSSSQGEVPFEEKQEDFACNTNISVDCLHGAQNQEVTGPPQELENGDLVQQTSSEEAVLENKESLRNPLQKSENHESNNDEKSSVPSGSVFPLNSDSWKEKFEKASSSEGMKWKMKSLVEDHAVFEVFWQVFVFDCTLQVEVKRIGASQSSISFVPVGGNLRSKVIQHAVDDIQDRAYNYFKYLVTDTVLPITICSDDLIDKLAEYSKIAKNVEVLMLDLMKLGVAGTQTVSYELDPLKVYFEVINTHYECVLTMTFYLDLRKYPGEKIIPEIKHMYCTDITKEVAIAVSSVEPGKDYLYRMVNVARDLKP